MAPFQRNVGFFDKWTAFFSKVIRWPTWEKQNFISGNFSRDLEKFSNFPKTQYMKNLKKVNQSVIKNSLQIWTFLQHFRILFSTILKYPPPKCTIILRTNNCCNVLVCDHHNDVMPKILINTETPRCWISFFCETTVQFIQLGFDRRLFTCGQLFDFKVMDFISWIDSPDSCKIP